MYFQTVALEEAQCCLVLVMPYSKIWRHCRPRQRDNTYAAFVISVDICSGSVILPSSHLKTCIRIALSGMPNICFIIRTAKALLVQARVARRSDPYVSVWVNRYALAGPNLMVTGVLSPNFLLLAGFVQLQSRDQIVTRGVGTHQTFLTKVLRFNKKDIQLPRKGIQ